MRSPAAFLLLGIAVLNAQDAPRQRLAFSGGWARQVGQRGYEGTLTAPGLGLSYGYRPFHILELEAGAFAALQPGPTVCNAHFCFDPNDRFIWLPFGARLVAPIGRVEISAGGGGLWSKYQVSNADDNPFGIRSRNGWGGYFAAGVALSLDRKRRWWIGTTPRLFLSNPSYARDRWFLLPAEVSWRF
jgi:hypothetical protein